MLYVYNTLLLYLPWNLLSLSPWAADLPDLQLNFEREEGKGRGQGERGKMNKDQSPRMLFTQMIAELMGKRYFGIFGSLDKG